MCDRGCCFSLDFLQRQQGRSPDATDQPDQGQSVICKQPQSEELSMGNIMNYDHSPKVPRITVQPPLDVELVELSIPNQFEGKLLFQMIKSCNGAYV